MCTKNNNENYLSTTTKEKKNNNKTKTLHAPKVNLVILKESMKKKTQFICENCSAAHSVEKIVAEVTLHNTKDP